MKKIYFIKNKDDFNSLMVDLEKEGARWASGHKPTELKYESVYGDVICVRDNTITSGALGAILRSVEEEIHIIHYTAKPENLGYSFKEILDMEWNRKWIIKYE